MTASTAERYARLHEAIRERVEAMGHTCAASYYDHPTDTAEWAEGMACTRCEFDSILDMEPTE